MLRIFGIYRFDGCVHSRAGKNIVKEMSCSRKERSELTKLETFEFKNLFLAYESLRSDESSRYSFVSKDNQQACFVIGNIFAYEEDKLKVLSGKNLAEFILKKYKKDGFSFLKHLRGEFNAVLIDKDDLFLVNDKLGLSSMYICSMNEGFVFCSEAEPIIWAGKGHQMDHTSIAEFLIYGFVPDGRTFIKDLINQSPGTVVAMNAKTCVHKKYFSIETRAGLNSLSLKKRARLVKDIFAEAVEIRVPLKGLVAQELTGGWDTRFILAGLLSSGRSPLAVTSLNTSRNDLLLSEHLTKKFNIQHCVIDDHRGHLERAFDYKFRLHKKEYFLGSRNMSLLSEDIRDVKLRKALLSKKFTGLFGSENFGFMSDTFFSVFKKKFRVEAKLKLSERFSPAIKAAKQLKYTDNGTSNDIFYLFLTQFVRSYWNVHMNMQRDRIFDFFSLHPFVDSKVIEAMGSLEYKDNMRYKLYTATFKQYDPAFLKIPYTFEYHRKLNGCADLWDIGFDREVKRFRERVLSNKEFLSFLEDRQIIKNKKLDHDDLKKMYCLFIWRNTYRPVLRHKADAWLIS